MLAHILTFSPEQGDSFFEQIPASAAVFLLRGEGEPYVSKTANLRRRLQRLLGPAPEHSKKLNLRDRVRQIQFTQTGSDFESQLLLYQLLQETFPKNYATRLRLRPTPLVKLHLENAFPRASVTTRLGKLPIRDENAALANVSSRNLYYGPFPSRTAAEKFAGEVLDFFKMRRCVEDLHPDPSFPGCVYSEMKMCLAPCFNGCSDDEYQAEVLRVQKFFDSRGESLTRELAEERDRASAELKFEDAATWHTKVEKLKTVIGPLPEIVRRIDQLQAIIIQPSAEMNSVALFRFLRATLHGPMQFTIEETGEPQSMESRLHAALAGFPALANNSVRDANEQLALLSRWYYRSNRVGEIFFMDGNGAWPMRRMVRAIGRVYRGEKAQEPPFLATTQSPI
ncbi:MAG TPA: hypothetical protein VJO35_07340 [Terriglobales bacterium]|nr:hypothetical protein [Terriglobales bacterium]